MKSKLISCTTLLFVLTLVNSHSTAQSEYARQIVDTLCSEHFDGRGYVNKGDVRSADFVIDELQRLGVQCFKKHSYAQPYMLNVNTFPYPIHVSLGDDTLIPGENYLIDPASGTAQGEFELVEINSQNFYSVYNSKISFKSEPAGQKIYALNFTDVKDKEKLKTIRAYATDAMNYFPAIWVSCEKKMWSVGRSQKNYPLVVIDSASYKTVDKVNMRVNNRYIPNYETKNVIGYIPGKKKKEYVVFSAHLDHLGRMGPDTYFPGANDNASGVAMLLSLAAYYMEHPPQYSIVFCFFTGEEAGLEGSRHFVSNPFFKLNKVKFVLNIDIMGAADKGITVVNATVHEEAYNRMVSINNEKKYLAEVKKRGPTANSDHYFFAQAGVPAFFMYSMGSVTNYHDVYDKSGNTPLTKFDEVQQLLIEFVAGL